MDSTEQRKVIAEFMGWTYLREETRRKMRRYVLTLVGSKPGDDAFSGYQVPDYPNDLNSMHEVEAELERQELDRDWVEEMWGIVRPDKDKHQVYRAFPMMHATAAQRAQAAYEVITQQKEKEG